MRCILPKIFVRSWALPLALVGRGVVGEPPVWPAPLSLLPPPSPTVK